MDDSGNVILFRLPKDLLLKPQLDTRRRTRPKTHITTLPYDIVSTITDNLDLTDRVCLGLTCKSIALAVTCVPRIPITNKLQGGYRVNGVPRPDLQPLYISMVPEWYTLLPRLGKGWVPRSRYKHCWKCNKIYPRDSRFYETKLCKDKATGWLWKLNLTERKWQRMPTRARHEHMISRWLTDDDLVHESLRPPKGAQNVYYPDLGIWATQNPGGPGPECPMCLEQELIYSWRSPHPVGAARLAEVSARTAAVIALTALVGACMFAFDDE